MEEEEKEKLARQRKGYDTNRNLALALCVLLVYMTFKDFKQNPGSHLFYVVMALLFLAALGVAIKDTILIKKIDKQLRQEDGN